MQFRPASIFIVTLLLVVFLAKCIIPRKSFQAYTPPPRPDYSLQKNWAALPTMKDSADALPPYPGLSDGQADAKVDVFFIHPTLYFKGKSWNADLDDEATNKLVDKFPVRQQACVFNGSCKVYAPRYRQATLASFSDGDGDGRKALDTAYNDVRAAFRYYLAHYNNGRPFIIASHSQGTFHATKLIAEFVDNDPALRKLFVAAYLVGGSTSRNAFTTILPCDSAAQTGCYVAWHSRKWGTTYKPKTEKNASWPGYDNVEVYECVNPLTWRRDTVYAPASLNKGSLPSTFDRLDVGIVDAKISPAHILWSHKPAKRGYRKGDNYHVMDYSLFWMNIRENVATRVERYFSKAEKRGEITFPSPRSL